MIRPSDPNLPTIDQVEEEVSSYARMRIDAFKLGIVDNLSSLAGKALAAVMVIMLCCVALMLFSVALVMLISTWVGSLLWATVILGGFYLLAALVLWLLRGKFVDKMVGTFAKMFFSAPDHEDE